MPASRVKLMLVAIAAAGVLLAGLLALRPTTLPTSDAAAALTKVCDPSAATAPGCSLELFEAAISSTSTAVGVVDVLLAVLDTRPGSFGGCHTALHRVGQRIATFVTAGEQLPPLGERWVRCGRALSHGTMETVGLGSAMDDAVATARTLCSTIVADSGSDDVCTHSVGHAFFNSLGEDFTTMAKACRMMYENPQHLEGCISAGYMSVARPYLERLMRGAPPTTVEEWTAALPECRFGDPYDFSCPRAFSPLASRSVTAAPVIAYLKWCDRLPGARPICVQDVATSLGINLAATPDRLGEIYPLCAATTADSDELAICIHGAQLGGVDGGIPATEILERLCADAPATVSCEELSRRGRDLVISASVPQS